MRFNRLALLLLGVYFVFLGGGAYYGLSIPVRVFHHAFVTLLLIGWLAARLRRGQGLPHTPLNLAVYAAVGWWFVTAFASIDLRMALEHLWLPLTHVLFWFVLVDLIQRRRERQVLEAQFMVGALIVVVTGLELASWYFGLNLIPETDIGWVDVIGPGAWLPLEPRRVLLAMGISTLLAGYVAPLVTLTVGWALTTRREYRPALWGLAGSLLIVLILTFSRGGLLSLAAGLGLLIVFQLARLPRLNALIPGRVLLGAAAVAGLIAAVGLIVLFASPGRQSGDLGRVDMWRGALVMTASDPLTGVGPGLFGRAFRLERTADLARDKFAAAHNAYLNTAAETGLPGVAISVWLGVTLLVVWWRNWQAAPVWRRIRLEAALAGLVGLAVHSLVDAFTITPIVLLMALLVALCVAVPRRGFALPPSDHRLTAVAALAIVIAYGVAFVPTDLALLRYQQSLAGGEAGLAAAQAAAALDPALDLYPLQTAYLYGQMAGTDDPDAIRAGLLAYERALVLEPTWDTGWLNHAVLALRLDDAATALASLDRARQINPLTSAPLHWARLAEAENAAAPDAITAAYTTYLSSQLFRYLPLAAFWWETEPRRAAVERMLDQYPLDWQYRVLAVHDPDRALDLLPVSPTTPAEWWMRGEWMLSVIGDANAARGAFTWAVELEPTNGDYWAARARATVELDPEAARRDLNIARLLGTVHEYPGVIAVDLAESADEADQRRLTALPPRTVGQEFAAVLYSRPSGFDVLPAVRHFGPGRAAMQPWYTLAEQAAAAGDLEAARNILRAIIDYAPDEHEARERLADLSAATVRR